MEKIIKLNYILGVYLILLTRHISNLFIKYNMLMAGAILIAPAINLIIDLLKKISKNYLKIKLILTKIDKSKIIHN